MQLMALLQQQEQRILHREKQLLATDTSNSLLLQETAAASVAHDSLHRTQESISPPQHGRVQWSTQQQQQHHHQQHPTEYFTGLAGFPDSAVGGCGSAPVMYSASASLQQQHQQYQQQGQQRLHQHVIAGHKPQSATVAFVPSTKGKGKGRFWGVTRAVVVGCTYTQHKNYNLRGPANDAHLLAHALVQLLRVEPDNLLLLSDALPDTPYRGSRNSSSDRVPRAPPQRAAAKPRSSSSSREHPKGLVLHPTVDISKLEDPQPNASAPTQPTKQNILMYAFRFSFSRALCCFSVRLVAFVLVLRLWPSYLYLLCRCCTAPHRIFKCR